MKVQPFEFEFLFSNWCFLCLTENQLCPPMDHMTGVQGSRLVWLWLELDHADHGYSGYTWIEKCIVTKYLGRLLFWEDNSAQRWQAHSRALCLQGAQVTQILQNTIFFTSICRTKMRKEGPLQSTRQHNTYGTKL